MDVGMWEISRRADQAAVGTINRPLLVRQGSIEHMMCPSEVAEKRFHQRQTKLDGLLRVTELCY
jgi:hypothetical protein